MSEASAIAVMASLPSKPVLSTTPTLAIALGSQSIRWGWSVAGSEAHTLPACVARPTVAVRHPSAYYAPHDVLRHTAPSLDSLNAALPVADNPLSVDPEWVRLGRGAGGSRLTDQWAVAGAPPCTRVHTAHDDGAAAAAACSADAASTAEASGASSGAEGGPSPSKKHAGAPDAGGAASGRDTPYLVGAAAEQVEGHPSWCIRRPFAAPGGVLAHHAGLYEGEPVLWDAHALLAHVLHTAIHPATSTELTAAAAAGMVAGCTEASVRVVLIVPDDAEKRDVVSLLDLLLARIGVHSVFPWVRSLATCFALSLGTALVVNVGHTKTSVVPVVDGVALRPKARFLPYGVQQCWRLFGWLVAYEAVTGKGAVAARGAGATADPVHVGDKRGRPSSPSAADVVAAATSGPRDTECASLRLLLRDASRTGAHAHGAACYRAALWHLMQRLWQQCACVSGYRPCVWEARVAQDNGAPVGGEGTAARASEAGLNMRPLVVEARVSTQATVAASALFYPAALLPLDVLPLGSANDAWEAGRVVPPLTFTSVTVHSVAQLDACMAKASQGIPSSAAAAVAAGSEYARMQHRYHGREEGDDAGDDDDDDDDDDDAGDGVHDDTDGAKAKRHSKRASTGKPAAASMQRLVMGLDMAVARVLAAVSRPEQQQRLGVMVVVVGGGARIAGLTDALEARVRAITGSSASDDCMVHVPGLRQPGVEVLRGLSATEAPLLAWRGAQSLAPLAEAEDGFITGKEWCATNRPHVSVLLAKHVCFDW